MDGLLTLAEAAKLIPGRNGRKIHVKSLRRWIVAGVRGARLQAVRVGGVWMTSQAWLDAFAAASTASALGTPCPPPPVFSEAHERAVKVLAARYGIHVPASKNGSTDQSLQLLQRRRPGKRSG